MPLSRLLFVALVIAIAAVSACSSGTGDNDFTPGSTASLSVISTIYPVTYLAERVGGDRVDVQSLAKPGIDAHDFEPSPRDIIELRSADVFVYTDPAFEVWVEDALDSLGSDDLLTITTADLPSGDDSDPHVWLNPVKAGEQARAIQTAFASADPAGADTYRANTDDLVTELQTLDNEFTSELVSCSLNTIVVSHLAYGHLAERYELDQIGLADLSAEFETTPRRVADIIEQIELLGIGHILQEPILSDDLAQTVADETGAVILPLHPLESLTSAEVDTGDDYFTVMRRNLQSLKTALGCS